MPASYRSDAQTLWCVLFQCSEGNVMIAVLPFCIVNCLLLALVEYAGRKKEFGFSPNGHGLLTLLISFLVISKVNIAYDRFRAARHHIGDAFTHLRELNQLIITMSESHFEDDDRVVLVWRSTCVDKIVEILDTTRAVVQNEDFAKHLARNEPQKDEYIMGQDPLCLAQSLRLHLYTGLKIQLLERVSLISKLNEYIASYRNLLEIASTPLPFPLTQMGRTFLFIWTFSMPLVLRQGPFSDLWTAMLFLFFLTYGFIGLELVAMSLIDPFGDRVHDVQVTALRDATIVGIEKDLEGTATRSISQRRLQFRQQKGPNSKLRSEDKYETGNADSDQTAPPWILDASTDHPMSSDLTPV